MCHIIFDGLSVASTGAADITVDVFVVVVVFATTVCHTLLFRPKFMINICIFLPDLQRDV